MKRNIYWLFVLLMVASSCKTVERGKTSAEVIEQKEKSSYTILVRYLEMGGAINELLGRIESIAGLIFVRIIAPNSFLYSWKEVEISISIVSVYQLNQIKSELYRLPGIITADIQKN